MAARDRFGFVLRVYLQNVCASFVVVRSYIACVVQNAQINTQTWVMSTLLAHAGGVVHMYAYIYICIYIYICEMMCFMRSFRMAAVWIFGHRMGHRKYGSVQERAQNP